MKRPTNSCLCETIGDSVLSFEFVPLASDSSVGVVRVFENKDVGVIEQDLVFNNRAAFDQWVKEDEFFYRAPQLFISLRRMFDLLLNPESRIDVQPS